jgi:hypothetical protein
MALVVGRYTSTWRDAKGWTTRVTHYVSEDNGNAGFPGDMEAVAVALRAAIVNLTNAAFQGDTGFVTTLPVTLTYGTNAEYPAEWMKAQFTFSTDLGSFHRFKIPAPKIAIMETDGITVINDGTNAAVVAYVNAVKNASGGAFCSTKTGLPFTHFIGGIVRLGKQPRRFNELIKSAKLVQGEGE